MNNYLPCYSCNHKNPLYQYNCEKCHAFLRTKVANLEMSKFLWKLIESPSKAFVTLIQSEQKNFVYLILFLISLKFFQLSITAKYLLDPDSKSIEALQLNLPFTVVASILFILIFSFVSKLLFSFTEFKIRFKDILATNVYSLFPILVSFILIFPIEIALFGKYWILNYPSPFMLKPTAAYTLWAIEGCFLLWSISLSIISNFVQTKSILLSIIVGLSFVLLFIGFSILLPLF